MSPESHVADSAAAKRHAHCDEHDAFVNLQPTDHELPSFAYAIAKKTYRISAQSLELTAPRVLAHDPYAPDRSPKLPRGSDFWWTKCRADVVVEGSAWGREGKPLTQSEVCCEVGVHKKRIAVFGKRRIEWTTTGRPFAGPPEPTESIPLDDSHAYGGLDPRVPTPRVSSPEEALRLISNHPGFYPRNPIGKGYLVMPDRVDGIELPNLEDPDDLLTDERLIVLSPDRWHRQPLPWTLGWQHAMSLTRLARLGADAHHPVDDPRVLKEVQRGFLPADYRERWKEGRGFDVPFHQEASLGMSFPNLAPGTPIEVTGVHPERPRIAFEIPEPADIEITIESSSERPPPTLTAVIIEPDHLRVSFVYVAKTTSLPRTFIPGIHPHIPLSARVDGGPPAHYETPPVRRRPA